MYFLTGHATTICIDRLESYSQQSGKKNVNPLNPFVEDLQDRLDCLYFGWIYMVSCNLTASAKNA